MAQEIEIEFKNLLTETEYEQLLQYFEFKKEDAIIQTNHYFETKDFKLKEKNSALRIREKNHLFQLTLKEPHPEGLLETHDTLSEAEAHSWFNNDIIPKPHVAKQLNQLGVDFADLHYGGKLSTHRLETTYKDTTIVLDYSSYSNTSDYELEIEAKNKNHGETIFNNLLNEHNIPKRVTPNKIKRFYSTL
ncbi:CYTH domain-containing protein [Aquibacillus rhizosphaerae]|uniref:CYTH domain-containing protein n=1 Tax=Aquibacillus rhizosphaerae TaxID=3051431 RepID=A0ABT7LEC2_9BACI|nr:CYTH domain-containing protein [Aquibacillus sp. LR5S19]MDL4842935.1 CYTH domain-containing protein [Aquibacillus sp. LR5S19]